MNILEIPVEELQFRNAPGCTIVALYPGDNCAVVVYKDTRGVHLPIGLPICGCLWEGRQQMDLDIIRKPQKRWRVLPLAEIVRKCHTDTSSDILYPPEGENNCFTVYAADGMHHHCGKLLPKDFVPGRPHSFGDREWIWKEWMLEQTEEVEVEE
jgi:hypothetical protein